MVARALQRRRQRAVSSQGEIDPRFYAVLSGKVKVHAVSANGHELLFDILGAGGVIGESSALLGLPRHTTARVVEAADVLMLHAGQMEHYVRREPKLAMALIQAIGANQRRLIERLEHAIFGTPEERILGVLSQRSDVHPDAVRRGPRVRVNLTREQIGHLTGLSRVTVTRALMRLQREGSIALVGREIVLPDSGDAAAPEPARPPRSLRPSRPKSGAIE